MDMTLTMDISKAKSSRDRAQHLLNKNLDLEKKRRDGAHGRTHFDPNVWQIMRENYEAIVLEDHEFSEKHDIEYALWQLHYRRIEELRALFNAAMASSGSGASSNGKSAVQSGPDRLAKIRSQFKSFLSEATGFYHDMMVKIRAKYGLPLGYFSDVPDNQMPTVKNGTKSTEVKNGLISCHRCLIYLGDLARYKALYGETISKARDLSAASSYYMQASSIWSSSGNPHHQLALLAGYSNDELLTIYRYFRSLAAENPFPTARDNLIIAFEKNRQAYNQLVNVEKVSSTRLESKGRRRVESRTPIKGNKMEAVADAVTGKDFTTRFIRMNGILFTRTSLETFPEVLLAVKNNLVELLSSGVDEKFTFGSDAAESGLAIVRMTSILIFTVHNVSNENENQSYADILQRSVLLRNASTATFEFMGSIVDRCNQLADPSKSFLLPGIGVFFEWLACHENLVAVDDVDEKEANARSFCWRTSASLLNKLLSTGYILVSNSEDESCFADMGKYDESETNNRRALPEDFELRGFVPLLPSQRILDFSRNHFLVSDGGQKENISRVQRIVAAGKALTNTFQSSKEKLYFESKLNKFAFGIEPKILDDGSVINHADHDFSISVGAQLDTSAVPKSNMDPEEDEEVIVFKPFTVEKTVDEISSKLASSANLSAVDKNANIDIGTDDKSSVSNDTSVFQCPISFATTPSPFINGIADGTSQYLQPVQPSLPSWSLDISGHSSDSSSQKVEKWPILMTELQVEYGVSQIGGVSLPIPQFSIAATTHGPSAQTLQTHVPFESVLPHGASGLKKNPISRPARRVGPPPGFGSVGPKVVDDHSRGVVSRSENPKIPAMDDYRWLDGYNLPSSHSTGFSSSVNQMGPKLPSINQMEPAFASGNQYGPAIPAVIQAGPISSSVSMIKGSMAAEMNPSHGNQALHEYHFPEYMNHYENLAQQFQKDNQKAVDSVQPHQDSAWGGQFFV